MATITQRVDDITGSNKNVENVTFSIDGADYEIDLAPTGREALRTALQVFIENARPVPAKAAKSGKAGAKRKHSAQYLAEARKWARKNGFPDVASRGRIPAAAMEAFIEVHGGA